jgi:hypothetical protein
MEVICSGSTVNDLQVNFSRLIFQSGLTLFFEESRIIVAELKESFNSCRGMLWSLTIHTVGQVHYDTRLLFPFSLTRYDKVIDHDLSTVGEITELSFPDDKIIWIANTVSILKSKHTVF